MSKASGARETSFSQSICISSSRIRTASPAEVMWSATRASSSLLVAARASYEDKTVEVELRESRSIGTVVLSPAVPVT